MKKDFLFTNPGNNPFLGMENSRSFQKKKEICGSFKFVAAVKVLFQTFLKLNYFIEAVKPFHPKGKPQNVSSLSNYYYIYLVLLTNTFL